MKGRQIYLDTIGGILICYMMLMHILLWRLIPLTNDSIWLEPLKFFMFWFFFKSGEFFRLKETRAKLISICGCITVNNIFKHIPHLPLLTYIGKNSMDFYVMHMLVLGVITMLPWSEWMIPNYVVFGVMCIACLTVPAFIGYLLEHSRYAWVLGKTNK